MQCVGLPVYEREREKNRERESVGVREIEREISVRQDERGSKNTVRYVI